ncbi:MAG: hypothetical protein EOM23_07025 [Candidatus Moranbacteria bacterium]|nr:hypothetical protein [Candidatus Moranbacteria bacterium]
MNYILLQQPFAVSFSAFAWAWSQEPAHFAGSQVPPHVQLSQLLPQSAFASALSPWQVDAELQQECSFTTSVFAFFVSLAEEEALTIRIVAKAKIVKAAAPIRIFFILMMVLD